MGLETAPRPSNVDSLQPKREGDSLSDQMESAVETSLIKDDSTLSNSLGLMRSRKEIHQDDTVDVGQWKSRDDNQNVITAMYCKILVLLGLAFPMAESFTDKVPSGYYEGFMFYLFSGSLLFLLYVYIHNWRTKMVLHWQTRKTFKAEKKKTWLKDLCKGFFTRGRKQSITPEVEDADIPLPIDQCDQPLYNNADIPRPKNVYGSLYLRLGAVVFGIGSMIHSGIEIGLFFEISMHTCQNSIASSQPFLRIIFVFVQMYYIFLNQKMNIYKRKFASRLGLMHMIATNLCIWINVIIMETKHEVLHNHDHDHDQDEDQPKDLSPCSDQNTIMGNLMSTSAPFLFPCTIEYSLICAAILYTMWKNIVPEHSHYTRTLARIGHKEATIDITPLDRSDLDEQQPQELHQRYYMDCSRANNGLFCGIIVIVFTTISIILFFVLMGSDKTSLNDLGTMMASITELILYSLTTIAVIIGTIQVRKLWYDNSKKLELDNLLLLVAQTGVLIYSAFCMIGAFFQMSQYSMAFLAALATMVQTMLQTIFILDASNRFAYCSEQVKQKPGRQVVTFLLICNLAMWAINTLETNRADSHPIQGDFYGGEWVWPIITHVSMPLAIFYRFHSTVCLCEIWSHSFTYKDLEI